MQPNGQYVQPRREYTTDRLDLMDVPAIPAGDWQEWLGDLPADPHAESKVIDHIGYVRLWTCADKSRILSKAEDGTRHCVKFPARD
jgi:hypothetical protein